MQNDKLNFSSKLPHSLKTLSVAKNLLMAIKNIWAKVWVVPEKIHTHPQRKFPPSGEGRDCLKNALNLYRMSREGGIANFLCGGGVWIFSGTTQDYSSNRPTHPKHQLDIFHGNDNIDVIPKWILIRETLTIKTSLDYWQITIQIYYTSLSQ